MSLYKVDESTGDLSLVAGGTLYADTPIGTVQATLDPSAPSGWVFLRGQTVSRNEWLELLDWATKKGLIGSGKPFGPGDGSTTFVLPDLREATLKGTGLTSKSENHYDADGVALGEFVEDRLQAHTHSNKTGTTTPGTQAWTMFATTQIESAVEATNDGLEGRFGTTTEVKAIGVNFMIKAKHTPVPADFLAAVDEAMNECKILPYSLNRSSNVSDFNRKWLVDDGPITWTATHTGRLTVRCLKHGDGYSLYLTNQSGVLLDSYDNFFGDDAHTVTISEVSITLQAWVKKGDVIKLETNLPASSEWADKYFVQTGLLLYNDNYD